MNISGPDEWPFRPPPYRLHLFEAYGVELEYMIVDRDTLQVRPLADELLKHELGYYGADLIRGQVTWSNEMVLHVLELKATQPESNLSQLGCLLADEVRYINNVLRQWNARLLPGGCHPSFNPNLETRLWPHESNEIYATYHRIFNCNGHGWSNAQSTHLNLPFYDDEEFARLHAAVRLVLPLVPALCASSPIVEGRLTGYKDTRLKYYGTIQSAIPSITGKVIPEAVFSRRTYLKTIYAKIREDLKPLDPLRVLNPIWVNSRGAIPRFDRGSLELRLMDAQECPAAEMAVLTLISETVRALVQEELCSTGRQMKYKTTLLADVLNRCIEAGEKAVIPHAFAEIFCANSPQHTAGELWQKIFETLAAAGHDNLKHYAPELSVIFGEGTLASRIIRSIEHHGQWQPVYRLLADCLEQNRLFIP